MGIFAAILFGAAVGGGAAIALSRGGGGGGGAAPKPQPLPGPPKVEDAERKAEALRRDKLRGRTQTVFTSPLGIGGEADVARKTLLGR